MKLHQSQWLMRLDLPMWRLTQMQTCIRHTDSLSAALFSYSTSPSPPLAALHSVMDEGTCPKVLYRQHTCCMSLHADVTLQLQPCTVGVCVCVCVWHPAATTQAVWRTTSRCRCAALHALTLSVNISNRATSHVTLSTAGNERCVWPDAFIFRRWLLD